MNVSKVLYVSMNEIVIYYEKREPFRICTDNGTALEVTRELLYRSNGIRLFQEENTDKLTMLRVA